MQPHLPSLWAAVESAHCDESADFPGRRRRESHRSPETRHQKLWRCVGQGHARFRLRVRPPYLARPHPDESRSGAGARVRRRCRGRRKRGQALPPRRPGGVQLFHFVRSLRAVPQGLVQPVRRQGDLRSRRILRRAGWRAGRIRRGAERGSHHGEHSRRHG